MTYADDIKRLVPMTELCDTYGIAVNRGGFALCPFHADRNASLKVYKGNRGFCCFACGKTGSVIDFTMQFYNLDFKSACAKLNEDFRLGLPIGKRLSAEERKAAHSMAVLRRAEKERKRREAEQLKAEYESALDEYVRLDRAIIAHKPLEPPHIGFEYAQAVKHMPIAKYRLECAEIALSEYERRGNEV